MSTVTTVWQRMRDERQLDVGLTTFRLYVRKRIGTVPPEDATVRKPPPPPGEIAEVDFKRMGMWDDPISGRRRVVQAFVMVLGFSRRTFVMPVLTCDQAAWVECHRRAFAFFGAVPHQIRLDNLKTGVLKADIYDPQFNRTYRELGEHYGVVIDPCRGGKPKDIRRHDIGRHRRPTAPRREQIAEELVGKQLAPVLREEPGNEPRSTRVVCTAVVYEELYSRPGNKQRPPRHP